MMSSFLGPSSATPGNPPGTFRVGIRGPGDLNSRLGPVGMDRVAQTLLPDPRPDTARVHVHRVPGKHRVRLPTRRPGGRAELAPRSRPTPPGGSSGVSRQTP